MKTDSSTAEREILDYGIKSIEAKKVLYRSAEESCESLPADLYVVDGLKRKLNNAKHFNWKFSSSPDKITKMIESVGWEDGNFIYVSVKEVAICCLCG